MHQMLCRIEPASRLHFGLQSGRCRFRQGPTEVRFVLSNSSIHAIWWVQYRKLPISLRLRSWCLELRAALQGQRPATYVYLKRSQIVRLGSVPAGWRNLRLRAHRNRASLPATVPSSHPADLVPLAQFRNTLITWIAIVETVFFEDLVEGN